MKRMDLIVEAVEAAFGEGARDYTELEQRVNAYLEREGRRPTCRSTLMRALKRIDPQAWEMSK